MNPSPQSPWPTPVAPTGTTPAARRGSTTAAILLFAQAGVLLVIAVVMLIQTTLISAQQSTDLCQVSDAGISMGECLLEVELKRRTADTLRVIGTSLLGGALTSAIAGGVCLLVARARRP